MADNEIAPHCPISHSQEPKNPRGIAPIKLPSIPLATDLPSLLRTINAIRDVLRTLTTSLTVNNTYIGNVTPAKKYGKRDYKMSEYQADWYQTGIDNKEGVVHGKSKPKDRAEVERMNGVSFRNVARDDDQPFYWRYVLPLEDAQVSQPFQEDFFERVIDVHWKPKQTRTYEISWFWNTTAGGTGHIEAAFGCVPWEPILPGALFIVKQDEGSIWGQTKFRLFGKSKNVVFTGEPTASGDGSSSNHRIYGIELPPRGPFDEPASRVVIGDSISWGIKGYPLSANYCWGTAPYPIPPDYLYAYTHNMSKLAIGQPVRIGTMTLTASGITASLMEGTKQIKLKHQFTQITMSTAAYGGMILVRFIHPDDA